MTMAYKIILMKFVRYFLHIEISFILVKSRVVFNTIGAILDNEHIYGVGSMPEYCNKTRAHQGPKIAQIGRFKLSCVGEESHSSPAPNLDGSSTLLSNFIQHIAFFLP